TKRTEVRRGVFPLGPPLVAGEPPLAGAAPSAPAPPAPRGRAGVGGGGGGGGDRNGRGRAPRGGGGGGGRAGAGAPGAGGARAGAAYGLPVLDTGLLYRAVGVLLQRAGGDLGDAAAAAQVARALTPAMLQEAAFRSRAAGEAASRVAVHPEVRAALLDFQRG